MTRYATYAEDPSAALDMIRTVDPTAQKVEAARCWEHTSRGGGRFVIIAVGADGSQYGVGRLGGTLMRFDGYRSVRATAVTRGCVASYRATEAVDDGGSGVTFTGDTYRVYGADPWEIERR